MNFYETKNGFSFAEGEVSFDFTAGTKPKKDGDWYTFYVCGAVPVPKIKKGDRLLLPVDEGVAVTAEKEYESGEFDCNCIKGEFCGREGTMSMVIVERENKFLLISLENGLNSSYRAERKNGLYGLEIQCSEKKRIFYGVYSSLTEACKSYRSTKKDVFLPLSEKIRRNPEIKKLAEGGIFWVWSDNYDSVMYADTDTDLSPSVGEDLPKVAEELYKAGVDNAMFGIFFDEDSHISEELYKKFGYISTQYDNYNDVLNPELLDIIPKNRVKNCGYTHRRMKDYPDGVTVNSDNTLKEAWALKGFDGKMHSQNQCCPLVASKRVKEEIPLILKEFPFYNGRFIDVYGGSLSECHHKTHPLTLSECLNVKKETFSFLSEEMKLVTGTEDGFEDILNGIAYSEGLHSPVYFRNLDSGRNHAHIYTEKQEKHIEKQMLNPVCRVPLWQLVYHECMLAFPYWGDSTEMSPKQIKRKILFACLYGCPPLYSFSVGDFEKIKEVIVISYKKICEINRKTAVLPMTDFQMLTPDRLVQKSVFGDKYEIVANFSDVDYVYKNTIVKSEDLYFGEI